MSNELKMFGRYAITAAVMYAAGKGWITPAAAGPLTDLLVQMAALIIAAGPPLYAAWKVDNSPKT